MKESRHEPRHYAPVARGVSLSDRPGGHTTRASRHRSRSGLAARTVAPRTGAAAVVSCFAVESRKAWRNRDASAVENVMALLETLREGLGADAIGLVDDDRAEPERGPSEASRALNFWEAFDRQPCAQVDWERWYRDLRATERAEITCGCPEAHHLRGFLIHARWALLLVVPPAIDPAGIAAIASSLRALADRLPPARSAEEAAQIARYESGDEEEEGASPSAGARGWLVRKLPQ